MTDRNEMEAVLEAILFVSTDPVPRAKLLEIFDEKERDEAKLALEALLERYREQPERGVIADEVAGGVRLVSRPDLHSYLRRFFEISGTNKLSMAALETLAIIAYRQPITGPEIQELRGVSPSGVIKTLLERHLVRVAGRKEVVGKPFLYATTREFLMHFGLKSLKELPPLEKFEEIFGGEAIAEVETSTPDSEEQLLVEAAQIEEAEEDAQARAERERDEEETAAREAAELAAEPIDDEPEPEPIDDEPEPELIEPEPEPIEPEPEPIEPEPITDEPFDDEPIDDEPELAVAGEGTEP